MKVLLAVLRRLGDIARVRNKTTSALVVSVALLASAHAYGTLPVPSSNNPQTAEAAEQETVNLAISGMV
ncbi:MAG: hypothetical protein L0Y58_07505 [Verrucomicrobia subdivision 3 bacterium]|nr:hypothetical protein [Limisphaerales bacterium]